MGTYGEYIKTAAAQAEADSKFRKTLNFWLKDNDRKLLKFARGKKGTLNYGRYVIMIVNDHNSATKKNLPKIKPIITILWGDFGLLARSVSHENQFWKFYRQKSSAEKKYTDQVRFYLN